MRARWQRKERGSRRGCSLPVITLFLLLAGDHADARASIQETDDLTVSEQIRQAGLVGAESVDLTRWHHGPVRYLLRGPELTFYRSLTTDEERLAFIHLFWMQRDPDTTSLTNDSRQAFWERVVAANDLFTHSAVPGWRTDMGRIYIMMGPPNEREWDSMPSVRQGEMVRTTDTDSDGDRPEGGATRLKEFGADGPGDTFHGLERWTYDTPPGRGLPPRFVIAFRRQSDGDFVLSANPRDISRFADSVTGHVPPLNDLLGRSDILNFVLTNTQPLRIRIAAGAMPPQKAPDMGSIPTISPNPDLSKSINRLAIALDLGKIDGVPDPDRLMGELITSREFFGIVPLLLQPGFYKTTGRATLTALTVGIHRSHLAGDGPDLRLAARLQGIDQPGIIRLLSEHRAAIRPSSVSTTGRIDGSAPARVAWRCQPSPAVPWLSPPSPRPGTSRRWKISAPSPPRPPSIRSAWATTCSSPA